MNKRLLIITMCILTMTNLHAQTWSEWFRQKQTQKKYMLQQIAKLQVYLGYVKQGYKIVHGGLDLIGSIKKGDLTMHTVFFDHLKQVNPTVKNYGKVAAIISMQATMLKTYKTNITLFKQSHYLSSNEIDFLYGVFSNLLDQLSDDIAALTEVMTDGKLEMSDDERLARVDKIYQSVTEKYNSLFSFMNKVKSLCGQREREINDLETLQKLYEP